MRFFPAALLIVARAWSSAPDAEALQTLFNQKCGACHGSMAMSGLDLRTREAALKGGARGPAFVAGQKDDSLLYQAVLRTGALKMPPGKQPLLPEEIELIGKWIDAGAPWTATGAQGDPSWWSFRRLQRPAIPQVKSASRTQNPIDSFLLAKLNAKGLMPARAASRQALIRRAYFDLHGLPPPPQEVDEFVADSSPLAYEKLIDRLLASPRYGERWGRHWLDVVRYADTGGHENDIYLVNAWRYRDYVIDAFNEDKPYNTFVQEQIAADEIWPNNLDHEGTYLLPKQKQIDLKRRIGTGLYTVGPVLPASAINPDQFRSERLSDWADVTGAAFLGLTVGCAHCHDHKFDPISQKDYYRLQAIFAASDIQESPTVPPATAYEYRNLYPKQLVVNDLKAALERLTQQVKDRLIEAKRKELPKAAADAEAKALQRAAYPALAARFNDGEKRQREALIQELGKAVLEAPEPFPTVDVLGHLERPAAVHVEIRGEWKQKGETVGAGFPSALGGGNIDDPAGFPAISHRRKDFALWLTQPDHPLTARVFVNRLWQGHFGWGIVRSANDFGRQGEAPDHPELLDWLASEFVAKNWSVKSLHKLIMLSNAYQASSEFDAKNFEIDPENRLLWRMNPRRLEAEAVRDAILAVSGNLNLKKGGPPVLIPLNEEEMARLKGGADRWPATTDAAAPNRRSVYLFQKRLFRIPLLEVFDLPETTMSCARRSTTNVAPQALALLNHPAMLEQARTFARRLMKEAETPDALIERAWTLAYGRRPSAGEKQKALALISHGGQAAATETSLAELCLTLFNTNEFLYID